MLESSNRGVSRNVLLRRAFISLLTVFTITCGGGGGGGRPPTAPPPPPPSTDIMLSGSVRGMFDDSTSFSGSTFETAGSVTQIDGRNRFSIGTVPSGVHVASFMGPAQFTRRVRLSLTGAGTLHFDNLELVEKSQFNLPAFDEVYRERDNSTVRFITEPRWVVDRSSFRTTAHYELVRQTIRNTFPPLARGFFSSPAISDGTVNDDSCETVPVGTIAISAGSRASLPCEDCIGLAQQCAFQNGSLANARIWFADGTNRSVIEHEIIHAIGASGHLERSGGSSIMVPRGPANMTGMDRKHLYYLYSRPPGTASPDDMSTLPPLMGTVEAGGQVQVEIGPEGHITPMRPIE